MKPERAINAYLELLNAPEVLEQCPRCKITPFHSFMRGMVVRPDWFGFRKKIFAVICDKCKQIVDYEDPNDPELKIRGLIENGNST